MFLNSLRQPAESESWTESTARAAAAAQKQRRRKEDTMKKRVGWLAFSGVENLIPSTT
jgi:hypothetical protein